ncbi:MAG: type 1 glutamine amidotransferase domain-containing protein [Solirubrobacteraceae bacterium]
MSDITSSTLQGMTVAFLVAQEGVEEFEPTGPREALEEAGARTHLIAPQAGDVQAVDHLDRGSRFCVDRTLEEAQTDEYDGLVLPGGVANPDQLRLDERATAFVREIFSAGKPVGVICHGPWTLIEADLVRGRTLTSWPSLRTDIRNAGGAWVDEEVVVDRGLVSSRRPDDIPAFNTKLVEELAERAHGVVRAGATA